MSIVLEPPPKEQYDLLVGGVVSADYNVVEPDVEESRPLIDFGFSKVHDPNDDLKGQQNGTKIVLIERGEDRSNIDTSKRSTKPIVWPCYSSTGTLEKGDFVEPNSPLLGDLVKCALWYIIEKMYSRGTIVVRNVGNPLPNAKPGSPPPRVIEFFRLCSSEVLATFNVCSLPHPAWLGLILGTFVKSKLTGTPHKRAFDEAFEETDDHVESDPFTVQKVEAFMKLIEQWDPVNRPNHELDEDIIKILGKNQPDVDAPKPEKKTTDAQSILHKLMTENASCTPTMIRAYQRLYFWSDDYKWWWDVYLEHITHYKPSGLTIPARFGSEYLRLTLIFSYHELTHYLLQTELGKFDVTLIIETLGQIAHVPKQLLSVILEEVEKEKIAYLSRPASSGLVATMGLGFSSRDESGATEEKEGILSYEPVYNDKTPGHMIKLVALKNIFSRQLPKMPREYIAKLVFDPNHRSFCMLKNGRVAGGVCYRPFYDKRFAEIAFLAVTSTEQVKGYGTRLMNHLKEHVKRDGIDRFLTYADNFAVGYFRKQGFSSVLSQPKESYSGYIKDYDVATLMECNLMGKLNYLKIGEILTKQKEQLVFFWKVQAYIIDRMKHDENVDPKALLRKIACCDPEVWEDYRKWVPFAVQSGLTEADLINTAEKRKVMDALKKEFDLSKAEFLEIHGIDEVLPESGAQDVMSDHPFNASQGKNMFGLALSEGVKQLVEEAEVDLLNLRGLRESNWTVWVEHTHRVALELQEAKTRKAFGSNVKAGTVLDGCLSLLTALTKHSSSWPFQTPVTADEAPDYQVIIKKPMDFTTMKKKIKNAEYQTVDQFAEDLKLVFNNCRQYNNKATPYYICADTLEAFAQPRLDRLCKQFQ